MLSHEQKKILSYIVLVLLCVFIILTILIHLRKIKHKKILTYISISLLIIIIILSILIHIN